jgi:hypothetical protein
LGAGTHPFHSKAHKNERKLDKVYNYLGEWGDTKSGTAESMKINYLVLGIFLRDTPFLVR